MQPNLRIGGIAVLVAGVVAAAAAWLAYDRLFWRSSVTETSVAASGVPVVMRSAGGLLEIATVTVHERFKRTDTKEFWGIALGTTVSIIQVPVTYRYHIEMAKEWPIYINDKTATVRAADVKPSLPAAIDTARMEKYTQNGWARFNKDENLETLERTITGQIQSRAVSPQYDQIVKDASRETVKTFVSTWLLSQRKWGKEPEFRIVVLFPGESLAARGDKSETL